jgi:hypothetical protein
LNSVKKTISVLFFLCLIFLLGLFVYEKDKNKYEPRLWIGIFDYRLNFRDVGESLNSCLKESVFKTNKIYRSNRYFSGWSCQKINNPDKIYSLNFSPWNPHSYYCINTSEHKLHGFHPNWSFEISDIENLQNWENPDYKNTMCQFIQNNLNDLIQHKSFLYHCDMGRDRTGAYTALLTMLLAEQKSYAKTKMEEAIECDYEKTPSLEKEKVGRMKTFLYSLESRGGVSLFVQTQCNIAPELIKKAASEFLN